jgi:predicted cobalt transporter CbtA
MSTSSTSERVVCASCSANNFATQAACWKCGKSLTSTNTNTHTSPAPRPSVAPAGYAANSPRPVTGVAGPALATPAMYDRPVQSEYVSPGNATAAAVVLGLLFPTFAIPVGIVFLMLDNKRKAAIGWQNIIWGVAGFAVHLVITAISLAPVIPMLNLLSKTLSVRQQQQQSMPLGGE